jgi:DNA-binding transcriptional regulator LsrR (DeoR family)
MKTQVKMFSWKAGTNKLTKEQVDEIRLRYLNEKITQRELAREFDVSQMQISRIIRREHWS